MSVFLQKWNGGRALLKPVRVNLFSGGSGRSNSSCSSSGGAKDIERFYQQYVSAFVTGDMQRVSTEFYRAPLSVSVCVEGNTIMRSTFDTALDVEQALTFQMEGMVARGYAGKSDMEPLKITDMTDVAKLIQTKGIRYHSSGEILEKIRASYVIEKLDEEKCEANDSDAKSKWFITSIFSEIIP